MYTHSLLSFPGHVGEEKWSGINCSYILHCTKTMDNLVYSPSKNSCVTGCLLGQQAYMYNAYMYIVVYNILTGCCWGFLHLPPPSTMYAVAPAYMPCINHSHSHAMTGKKTSAFSSISQKTGTHFAFTALLS